MAREPAGGGGCRKGALRGDRWEQLKRVVQRSLGLPFNDPRLQEWTEADYLREFAFLELETEDPSSDPADEQFDQDLALAAEGRWDELGLDSGPLTPVSVETFLHDDE